MQDLWGEKGRRKKEQEHEKPSHVAVMMWAEWLQPKPYIETVANLRIEINWWRFDPCRIGRNGVAVRIFPGLHSFHGFHAGAIGSAYFQFKFDPFWVVNKRTELIPILHVDKPQGGDQRKPRRAACERGHRHAHGYSGQPTRPPDV